MYFEDWCDEFKARVEQYKGVIAVVVKAKRKVSKIDIINAAKISEIFSRVNIESYGIIFNQADIPYLPENAYQYWERLEEDLGLKLPPLTQDKLCIVPDVSKLCEARSGTSYELSDSSFREEAAKTCKDVIASFIQSHLPPFKQVP